MKSCVVNLPKWMILMTCLNLYSQAEAQIYKFEKGNTTYEELVGPDTVTTDLNLFTSDVYFSSSFSGFNLKVDDLEIYLDTIFIGSEGYISLKSKDKIKNIFVDPLFAVNINSYNQTSCITNKVDFVNGEKVYKIQWKNVEIDEFPGYYINFQLWIFEKSQNISFCYGPSTIPTGSTSVIGQQVGIFVSDVPTNTLERFLNVFGDPSNPSSSNTKFGYMFEFPVEGTVYNFINKNYSSVRIIGSRSGARVTFPNPNSGFFKISSNENIESVEVFDLKGPLVKKYVNESEYLVDLRKQQSGMYIMRVNTDNERYTFRIIKQ